MSQALTILTRESPLAMWQALHIQSRLREAYPDRTVDVIGMTTQGDRILDKTLSKIGGKGLFVKELEIALLERRAHLAVHSLKDVPMQLQEEFVLAAVTEREDPRDAFVSNRFDTLASLPEGAVVGTASLRRELMLKVHYPHLVVKTVRGNVGTRLRKLDEGQYDALIMAYAGLKRLGHFDRIKEVISDDVSLPSPGQGALGIECMADDVATREALSFLNDENTFMCTAAERAVSRALGGSCQVPLAAYATIEGETMHLRALIGDHTTGEMVSTEVTGQKREFEAIAKEAVENLMAQGAARFVEKFMGNAQ